MGMRSYPFVMLGCLYFRLREKEDNGEQSSWDQELGLRCTVGLTPISNDSVRRILESLRVSRSDARMEPGFDTM